MYKISKILMVVWTIGFVLFPFFGSDPYNRYEVEFYFSNVFNLLNWWVFPLSLLGIVALISKPSMQICPWCAEKIKAQAKVCRFCGRDISEEHEAGR